MRFTICGDGIGLGWLVTVVLSASVCGGADDGVKFFEQRIRPVLVDRCYSCHSAEAAAKKTLKGNLLLDTREAMGFRALDNLDAIFAGRAAPDALT